MQGDYSGKSVCACSFRIAKKKKKKTLKSTVKKLDEGNRCRQT